MNIFRILGDLLHLLSFVVLVWKIKHQRSCAGISLKTQQLYFIVFVCRYLDLPWNLLHFDLFHLYLALMKIIFIGATAVIIYYISRKYKGTYNHEDDSLPLWWLILPCFILSLVAHEEFTIFEILWAFSIYLEAVTILPQLLMLQISGNVETLTSHYIFCLGGYRGLYLLNWIYRFVTEDGYSQWIVWLSGLVQTILFCDFFYYYVKGQLKGESISLPTTAT